MKFTICSANDKDMNDPLFIDSKKKVLLDICHSIVDAIHSAEMFAQHVENENVFIIFYRDSDGHTGFLNPTGYDEFVGDDWVNRDWGGNHIWKS